MKKSITLLLCLLPTLLTYSLPKNLRYLGEYRIMKEDVGNTDDFKLKKGSLYFFQFAIKPEKDPSDENKYVDSIDKYSVIVGRFQATKLKWETFLKALDKSTPLIMEDLVKDHYSKASVEEPREEKFY